LAGTGTGLKKAAYKSLLERLLPEQPLLFGLRVIGGDGVADATARLTDARQATMSSSNTI
tara:strand:+ start:5521 stop:5700 length:180 start_codon:yes stop_codon:yes gene_type:complete